MMIRRCARKARRLWARVSFYVKYTCTSEIVMTSPEQAREYLFRNAPAPDSTAFTHNQIGPMEYDLTIIIPAYNAEKWIEECLNSILDQKTQYRYLVKVVNDGSKDRTPELLEQYRGDERVEIIHQENKGYSGARNAALKHLPSEYVMFVDSDDYLLPGAIEVLLNKGKTENADIVEGNGFKFNEEGRLCPIKPVNEKYVMGVPWMKVIRSSLFECIEFPEGYLYEDKIIGSLIIPRAKKTAILDDEVYAYRIHSDSITQKHTTDLNRVHSYWMMELMDHHMKVLQIPMNYDRYCSVMRQIVFTYRRTSLQSEEIKKSIFAASCGFVEERCSDYLDRKDRYTLLVKALKKNDYGKYCVYCEANIY